MSIQKTPEIGYGSGNEFQYDHFDGTVGHDTHLSQPSKLSPFLVKFETWTVAYPLGTCLTAIRLTWDDGKDSGLIGAESPSAEKHIFDLQPGEYLTSVWLGHAVFGVFLGYIYLKTNKDREFKAGASGKTTFHLPIESGVVFGLYGHYQDAGLSGLGFFVLEDVDWVAADIKFDAMPDPKSIDPQSYMKLDGDNTKGDVPLTVTISEEKGVTNSTSTSETWSETASYSVKWKVDVLGIVGAETTVTFDVTHQSTKTSSHSETSTLKWEGSIDVPARQYYDIDLLYYTADVDVNYHAEVTFFCKNGTQRTHVWAGKAKCLIAEIAKISSRRIKDKE